MEVVEQQNRSSEWFIGSCVLIFICFRGIYKDEKRYKLLYIYHQNTTVSKAVNIRTEQKDIPEKQLVSFSGILSILHEA